MAARGGPRCCCSWTPSSYWRGNVVVIGGAFGAPGVRGECSAAAGHPTGPCAFYHCSFSYCEALDWLNRRPSPSSRYAATQALHCSTPPSGVAGASESYNRRCACLSAEGWALWVHGGSPALLYSHWGYPLVVEAFALKPLAGPPLGALRRCVRALQRLSHSCRRSSGEFKRGKRTGCAASLAHAGRAALSREPQGSSQ